MSALKTDYDLPPTSPGFAAAQAEMTALSQAAADLPGAALDIPYGADPRQRLDIFPAGPDAPVHVFLRGGFWTFGEKEDRRFPAVAWQTRGVSWVVPNYRLAPAARLPEIVADARAAVAWVIRHGADHGLDPRQIHLSGNSAGGHLSAMVAAGPEGAALKSLTLISGLYDLTRLLDQSPNAWLKMDAAAARAMSPVTLDLPMDLPITVACGGTETPAFLRDSADYAAHLTAKGHQAAHLLSPGKNHMEIILECGRPGTPVFEAMARHIP